MSQRSVLFCGKLFHYLVALGMGTAVSCGPDSAGIVLVLQGANSSVVRIEVTPKVGNKTLPVEVFNDIAGVSEIKLGFQLPRSYLGQSVSFQVNAIDSKGCAIKSTSFQVATDELRRYELKNMLQDNVDVSVSNNLFAIHGSSSKDIWAVGDANTVIKWNGCFWQRVPGPTDDSLVSLFVSPAGSDKGVFGTSEKKIYKYNATMMIWDVDHDPALTAGTDAIQAIHGTSENDVWAVASNRSATDAVPAFDAQRTNSYIYHRGMNGWAPVSVSLKDINGTDPPGPAYKTISNYILKTVYAINGSDVYVGGGDNFAEKTGSMTVSNLFLAKWNVGNWRTQDTSSISKKGQIISFAGRSTVDFWYGTRPLALVRSENGTPRVVTEYGNMFNSITNGPLYATQRIVLFPQSNDVWVNSTITDFNGYKSLIAHFNGSWTTHAELNSISTKFTSLWASAPDDVWFTAYAGLRARYDGQQFQKIPMQ